MTKLLPIALAFLTLSCVPLPPSPQPDIAVSVTVVKSMGLRQCEGGVVSPDRLAAELKAAGVTVHTASCGSDGLMRPAVCGGGTHDIGIFSIATADLSKAKQAGFGPMASDARVTPCR